MVTLSFAESTARNGAALRELQDVHGLQIRRFPETLMQRIADLSVEWIQETFSGIDALTDDVVNSYVNYRHEVMPWSESTIEQFNRNRRRASGYKDLSS